MWHFGKPPPRRKTETTYPESALQSPVRTSQGNITSTNGQSETQKRIIFEKVRRFFFEFSLNIYHLLVSSIEGHCFDLTLARIRILAFQELVKVDYHNKKVWMFQLDKIGILIS